jgi:hypothetical protein
MLHHAIVTNIYTDHYTDLINTIRSDTTQKKERT